MHPIWNINPVFFHLPLINWPVRYYGLIFALVFLAGFYLFRWQTLRAHGTEEQVYALVLPGFLGLIIGARLGHVLFYNFDLFLADPTWVFRIWEGGLTSHGATIGLMIALAWYARKQKQSFWKICDRFSFSAALGAAMVRLGNFFNSEIVGKITYSSFGVKFPRYDLLPPEFTPARYPTQLIEFGIGIFVLITLFLTDRFSGREKRPTALLSSLFLILYFTGRFLVEFLKERQGPFDDLILSRGQLLSILPLIVGVFLFLTVIKKTKAPC